MNSVSFYTLGCRLNQSETAVVERTFEKDGYRIVDINEPADIVIINTCTVTENGDADTRRLVNKINRINPNAKIALVGCQAQVQKEKLTEMKNVQWVVGNANKMDVKNIIKETLHLKDPQVITPAIEKKTFTQPMAAIDKHHTRANLKVQDGCDFFCSFCEIPYARGRARSRQFEDIILEANALAAAGHQEIILTGINVGTYQENGYSLLDIINALEDIAELKRIRISSIEPTTIDSRIIDKMASDSKLCRYLHIPLQSGSNAVLKGMKRLYNAEEFSAFILDVHNRVENICIGTDVIVGFPTETEEHFNETCQLLKELPIHYFHVFSYSERYLAKSKNLTQTLPVQTVQKRSKTLRELSQRKKELYYQQFLNQQVPVLFEQKKNGLWSGTAENYLRIEVSSDKMLSNQIHHVKLKSMTHKSILGELVR